MNGLQLTQLMQILGVTCRQVADACGYDNIYRVVKARGLGTAEIPIFIESSLSRLIGRDRYAAAIDRLVEVSEGEIRAAKRYVVCSPDIELTPTQQRWLQTIAAQYSSKRLADHGKEIQIHIALIDARDPTDSNTDIKHRASRKTSNSKSSLEDLPDQLRHNDDPVSKQMTLEELHELKDLENDIKSDALDDAADLDDHDIHEGDDVDESYAASM